MSMSQFVAEPDFPYCRGCGHHLIARNTVRALEALARDPLDVVLVTDIGCHGIVDRSFATHTIHGLHGRSVALGSGIAMGVPANKDIIVFLGDGGATIGLQHILEAARLNVDLTVVVHNNMLYGMTGGQPSGLTPCGFRTLITREGSPHPHHDLCQLAHEAGAPYARRVLGLGDFSDAFREALTTEGFALVEVLELCTSYALKMNPNLHLRQLAHQAGYGPRLWLGEKRPALRLTVQETQPSLLEPPEIKQVDVRFTTPFRSRMALVVSGSAGEGAQRAAELFAQAAIACGLHATKKGSYPVTVGVGFSTAEVIVSRDPIIYHGIDDPDYVVITSDDGLARSLERVQMMSRGTVWIDQSLDVPDTGAEVRVRDFRGRAGPRNAAILGLLTFAQETRVIPTEAMLAAIRESTIEEHIPDGLPRSFD
jgi:pyruvate/2-oxoacid:ferredoxin oxidoreductase beta subunit/Pyruvate/2-oxoacid:ferredoxin oxidoreductase gamma subunit